MDFDFSVEEQRFRQDLIDFSISEIEICSKARKEWDSGLGFGPNCWEILRKVGAKGWLCPTWPKVYGGLDLSYMYRYLATEQMHHSLNMFSTIVAGMAYPMILRHGTEKQK